MLLRQWRGAYLSALDAAGQEHYRPLLNLVGRAVEGGLDHYLAACQAEPEEAYQPLVALARAHALSPDYLEWLVRQGRVAAVQRGGRWYSTPGALAQYQAEVATGRYPAGRPPSAPPPT